MVRGYDNVKREGAIVPGRIVLQEERFPREYRVIDAKYAEIYQWAVIAHLGGVGWTFKGCTETQEEAEAVAEFWRGHCAPTWVVPVELAWGSECGDDKALTYEGLMALAKANYDKGGDGYFDKWDERVFNYFVENFGVITEATALAAFALAFEHEQEEQAAHDGASD